MKWIPPLSGRVFGWKRTACRNCNWVGLGGRACASSVTCRSEQAIILIKIRSQQFSSNQGSIPRARLSRFQFPSQRSKVCHASSKKWTLGEQMSWCVHRPTGAVH
mmetsp:Transcript_43675/g.91443  ORF Transcript_43675/g.91443 Transcript_43675/m.91443 type:complete len:105 (+) Transcript_43675:274-588(+)